MIPNGDNEAFLSIWPIRGNLTVPTEPDCSGDDRSIYSIKLIPNGDNEAFLNIWAIRGNLTVSNESEWLGLSINIILVSLDFLSCSIWPKMKKITHMSSMANELVCFIDLSVDPVMCYNIFVLLHRYQKWFGFVWKLWQYLLPWEHCILLMQMVNLYFEFYWHQI